MGQWIDQCPEFHELEVKLPRFNRNVDGQCLHRCWSEGLTRQTPRRQENQLGQFSPPPEKLEEGKKKKKGSYLALPGG